MDLDKLLKLAVDYLSDYFASFVAILQNPGLRLRAEDEITPGTAHGDVNNILPANTSTWKTRLDPRLFSFVILSIFAGSTINALIPGGRAQRLDFLHMATIVLATWFFFSVVIHAIIRLVERKASFWETFSISLQVFSVLYVLCSFAGALWGALVAVPLVRAAFLRMHWALLSSLVTTPALMYFLFQFLLLAIYLPLAMKYYYHLNLIEQFILGTLALVIVSIGYSIYPFFGFLLQTP